MTQRWAWWSIPPKLVRGKGRPVLFHTLRSCAFVFCLLRGFSNHSTSEGENHVLNLDLSDSKGCTVSQHTLPTHPAHLLHTIPPSYPGSQWQWNEKEQPVRSSPLLVNGKHKATRALLASNVWSQTLIQWWEVSRVDQIFLKQRKPCRSVCAAAQSCATWAGHVCGFTWAGSWLSKHSLHRFLPPVPSSLSCSLTWHSGLQPWLKVGFSEASLQFSLVLFCSSGNLHGLCLKHFLIEQVQETRVASGCISTNCHSKAIGYKQLLSYADSTSTVHVVCVCMRKPWGPERSHYKDGEEKASGGKYCACCPKDPWELKRLIEKPRISDCVCAWVSGQ